MSKSILEMELNNAISKYQKGFDKIQSRGYSEDTQCAINELGTITLEALSDFKKSILTNLD